MIVLDWEIVGCLRRVLFIVRSMLYLIIGLGGKMKGEGNYSLEARRPRIQECFPGMSTTWLTTLTSPKYMADIYNLLLGLKISGVEMIGYELWASRSITHVEINRLFHAAWETSLFYCW